MKKYFVCFAFVFMISILFSSCVKNREDEKNVSATEEIFSVKTELVEKSDFNVYIKLNGNVIANNSVSVYPEVSGKLVNTYVILGSKVQKGDRIAEINPSMMGDRYVNNIVYAPISGVITSMPLTIGSTVTQEMVVATVGDVSRLKICVDVPERYAGFLKKGIKADVHLVAYPDEVFSASVESYSPVIDEFKRTKQVFLNFDKTDGRIEAGMFAKIKLFIKNYQDVIVVSESAIIIEGEEKFVFVKNDDNTVTVRTVKTAENINFKVHVVEGLSAGEKVVTEGSLMLSDGVKVIEVKEGE